MYWKHKKRLQTSVKNVDNSSVRNNREMVHRVSMSMILYTVQKQPFEISVRLFGVI